MAPFQCKNDELDDDPEPRSGAKLKNDEEEEEKFSEDEEEDLADSSAEEMDY